MKILENQTIYICEHVGCSQYCRSKNHAVRHEKICTYNPANRYVCKGCEFYSEFTKSASKGVFYCTKLNDVRFSPYARHYSKHTRDVCADLGINEPVFADNYCELFQPKCIEPVELDFEFSERVNGLIKKLGLGENNV